MVMFKKINMDMNFKSQFITTSVTAISIFKNITLVGIGATLHIFCNKTCQLIKKINIENTRGEQIYGILPFSQDNKFLIFGGSFLIILSYTPDYSSVRETNRSTLPDWILEAKLLDNETKIATVSMQNRVQIWDLDLILKEIFECKERCILYSACICYDNYSEVTILSGTVFNQVLIWKISKDDLNYCSVLKRLQKHDGVVFSIKYDKKKGLICSTSDDRSAVLWKVGSGDLSSELSQDSINIFPVCQIYGHTSRVFQCLILNDNFVTGGEDSVVNIWSLDGKLIRKVETNQDSPIWAIDYDINNELVYTGGGNGSVYVFSLITQYKEEQLCLPDPAKPKIVNIMASNNFIVFTEDAALYLNKNNKWLKVQYFEDLKSYVILKVSKCRKLVALAGFRGQLHIYKETNNALEKITFFQAKNETRIMSLHWLSCQMLLICQEAGNLTLLSLTNDKIIPLTSFILPYSSERSTTTAVILDTDIVVGDRKGNIYLYKIGEVFPIQSLPKVHNHLGVTNLNRSKNNLISLGRNSTIKTFSKNENGLTTISSDKVPFTWLLDILDNLLIAFSGNNFIIWDYQSKRVLLDKSCGGGHRSWDFFKNGNTISFVHIKGKVIFNLEYCLDTNLSYNLIEPFHLKEVNCMEIIKTPSEYILISGGEDTTLRITMTNPHLNIFKNVITLKSHLSSIKCISIHRLGTKNDEGDYLIFSAGGRAQIVCWTLENSVPDLVCRENSSYYEAIDSVESENRIMDLCVIEFQEKIILFAACSDGFIKIFFVEMNNGFHLRLHGKMFYNLRCIFKIFDLCIFNKRVLVTLAGDGNIVFWDVEDIFLDLNIKPFASFPVHQSGINTFSKFQINSTSFLILTAGDDNTVALNYVNFQMKSGSVGVEIIDGFLETGAHWAQITGSFITNKYFLTASVDQRVILYKWNIVNEKIACSAISKHNSSIADIKGLLCFAENYFDIFVYGLGAEFLKLENK